MEIAIKKESDLSNKELAVRQANKVDGLEVTEEGEVKSVDRGKVEVLQQLIENFEQMMGEVAANLIAEEMKKEDVEPSKLPEELAERY
jgi:hypothetical protein